MSRARGQAPRRRRGTSTHRRQFLADDVPTSLADFDDWICRTVLLSFSPLLREARYLVAEKTDIRMETVNRAAWEAAALRLLEDVYTFAATGPRAHPDWQSDVLAVMNREVVDPRGWSILDWDRNNDEDRKLNGPSFPFLPLSRETLTQILSPVTAETAARLLVVMTYDWQRVDPEADVASVLADARTLLNRYGEDVSCYSNARDVRVSPSPGLAAGVTGWTPLTGYTGDFGFVVISPEEVGVFWSFHPI